MRAASLCADATTCPHQPTLPTLDYLEARKVLSGRAVTFQFADYPPSHQRAIWRARKDNPDKRRERRQLLWARAWMRRRR